MNTIPDKFWSRMAANYDKDAEYIFGIEIQQEIKNKLLSENNYNKIIEFGCGTGFFTKELIKKASHIIATDLSEEMVNIAQIQLKDFDNIKVEVADCQQTNYDSESFDTVIMTNVFMLVSDPVKSLKENYRLLKPGGKMIIVCYTLYGMNIIEIIKILYRVISRTKGKPNNIKPYSCESLAKLVEDNGYKVNEVSLLGNKVKAIYLSATKM